MAVSLIDGRVVSTSDISIQEFLEIKKRQLADIQSSQAELAHRAEQIIIEMETLTQEEANVTDGTEGEVVGAVSTEGSGGDGVSEDVAPVAGISTEGIV